MSEADKQTKKTDVKKVSVKLKRDVVQAGVERLKGSTIEVTTAQAEWLRQRGDIE